MSMGIEPAPSKVLSYAAAPRRWRWGRIVAVTLTVIAAATLYQFGPPAWVVSHYRILNDYWAQQKCLRCDPASLPGVRLVYPESEQSEVLSGGSYSKVLVSFQAVDTQCNPKPPRSPYLAILLFPPQPLTPRNLWSTPVDLLLHDFVRQDGGHRLVSIKASDNQLFVSAWSIATWTKPSRQVTDATVARTIILPSKGSLSIHAAKDPVDSNHVLLRATLAGTHATEGTIDIILHNNDTIELRPSFGWTSNDSRYLWAPAGKPSDAEFRAQQ